MRYTRFQNPLPALTLAVLLFAGASGCTYTQLEPGAYDPEPTYDVDYLPEPARGAWGQLSMWGYWIQVPEFGWVWQPDVSYDWQPYYHGHWAWTSYGWTWVSYEPFGWITYHYGYWNFDPHYGWYWIPEDYWYACGVTWLYYDDFVCWAPIPPPGCHLVDPWYSHTDVVWMVVDVNHFVNPNVGGYKYRQFRPDPRYGSKKVFRRAPEKVYVERRIGKKIREVDVKMGKTRFGDREYKRVIFPQEEKRTVDRYQPKIDRTRRPKQQETPDRNQPREQPAREKREKEPKAKPETRDTRPVKGKADKGDTSGSKKEKKKNG